MKRVTTQGSVVGITGSSGFIGSRVIAELSARGMVARPFEGDIFSDADLDRFFATHDIETLVHLVGTFNPPFESLMRLNVLSLQRVIEAGRTKGLRKVVLSSTGAVYGEPVGTESFESDPLRPVTLYGVAKVCAETCLRFYADTYGIAYVILRFPNVYGPGTGKGVINRFIDDIRSTGAITIHGSGEQSRNFLHVDDAARSLIAAVEYGHSGIFNISNPTKVTLNQLVELLRTRYSFTVRHEQADNALKDLLLNVDLARTELHFEPTQRTIVVW